MSPTAKHIQDLNYLLQILWDADPPRGSVDTARKFSELFHPISPAAIEQLMLLAVATGDVERHALRPTVYTSEKFAQLITALPSPTNMSDFERTMREVLPPMVRKEDIESLFSLARQTRVHEPIEKERYDFGLLCVACRTAVCLADTYELALGSTAMTCQACNDDQFVLVRWSTVGEEFEAGAVEERLLSLIEWWWGYTAATTADAEIAGRAGK